MTPGLPTMRVAAAACPFLSAFVFSRYSQFSKASASKTAFAAAEAARASLSAFFLSRYSRNFSAFSKSSASAAAFAAAAAARASSSAFTLAAACAAAPCCSKSAIRFISASAEKASSAYAVHTMRSEFRDFLQLVFDVIKLLALLQSCCSCFWA